MSVTLEISFQERAKGDMIEYADNLPSPRVVKTHLPVDHLPKDLLEKAKVIYVARNPKDQIVSWFHHMPYKPETEKAVSVDDFALDFIKGNLPYGDYFKHLKVRHVIGVRTFHLLSRVLTKIKTELGRLDKLLIDGLFNFSCLYKSCVVN